MDAADGAEVSRVDIVERQIFQSAGIRCFPNT